MGTICGGAETPDAEKREEGAATEAERTSHECSDTSGTVAQPVVACDVQPPASRVGDIWRTLLFRKRN